MSEWLKNIINVVKAYNTDKKALLTRLDALEKLIGDRTTIAADINYDGRNHIIVVGRYKNTDYVQTFSINSDDFQSTIEQLRIMERSGRVRYMDAPPSMRQVFHRRAF